MSNRKNTPPAAATTASHSHPKKTKAVQLLELVQRERGATPAEMMQHSGWQAHTVRAALTGLRKKGHAIIKGKRDDVTCYSVVAEASE